MGRVDPELNSFHRDFLAIEQKFDLFDFQVGGVYVWERVRHDVATEALALMGLTGEVEPEHEVDFTSFIQGSYLTLRNVVSGNPYYANSPEVLLLGLPRREFHDGQWWDVYCDPIHEGTPFQTLQLEYPQHASHYEPTRTTRLRYIDMLTLPAAFLRHFNIVNYDFSASETNRLEQVEAAFETRLGIDIDIGRPISAAVEERKLLKKPLDALLARLDPDVFVIVGSADKRTFIEASHDNGIPVVELQHGQVCRYAYQLSYPGDRPIRHFPDYFLSFGEFWNDAASFPLDDDRIIPVGFPYLERRREQLANRQGKNNLLFISTGESGDNLSKIACEVSRHPSITQDVVYKLHPVEYSHWQQSYPCLVDAPLQVVGSEGPTLYELFTEADVQIGVGSTALYEGLAFGLDTYLFHLPTVGWLESLVDAGGAALVESTDELISKLGTTSDVSIDRERYFKSNALENVEQTLSWLRAEGTIAESSAYD